MTAWTAEELRRIGDAVELRVSTRRPDGSLRPFLTIWQVRVDDAIYIRSARGPNSMWFQRAQAAGTGRIRSGGVERDVTFQPARPDVREAVDAAYHDKYDRYGPAPVGAVTGDDVLETTLRVMPTS